MSTELVPVIYALRSKLNEFRSLDEQVDAISEALLKLERIYSEYDRLEIVKYAKQLLSDQHLNDCPSDLLQHGLDVNLKNHLQMRGFGPIRKAIVSTLPGSGTIDLLSYKFATSSNKKQKTGGYSMSFNFDDFPMFETVDSMLNGLRTDAADKESLNKILTLDLSELIDHPQWQDLLQALTISVHTHGSHVMLVLAIYLRFVFGFKGSSQGLDALNEALTYLTTQWVMLQAPVSQEKSLVRSQIALFSSILQAAAVSLQVPYQKEADRAVVLIFTLLAKGILPGSETSSFGGISTIEALAGIDKQGNAIAALLKAIHPFTAFSYAVQTGLLASLLSARPSTTSSSSVALRTVNIRLQTVLVLLSCFGDNPARAIAFIEHHARLVDGTHMYDDSKHHWQGETALLLTSTVDAKSPSQLLTAIVGSNKRFMHLFHGAELMEWFTSSSVHQPPSTQFVLRWVAAQLTSVKRIVLAEESCQLRDMQLCELLRLALTACSSFPAAPADLLVDIVGSCKDLLELVEQMQSGGDSSVAMLGYISGLLVLFEGGPLQHEAPVRQVLLECLEDLLNRQIFASAEAGGSADVQTTFVRLLSVAVEHPEAVSAEHAANIAEVSVLVLQVRLTPEPSVAFEMTAETQHLLLQTLQTVVAEVAYQETLRDRQLVQPCAAVLLHFFLRADLSDTVSADCNARSVRALLSVFVFSTTSEVEECLADMRSGILGVMESEYVDADTWDRAQDVEQAPSTPFSALLSLLLGLVAQGHVSVVNQVCGESWGELIAAGSDNQLADLCAFCVGLLIRRDCVFALASECVFPYVLRLLCAALQSADFVSDLRLRYAAARRSESVESFVPDAAGADLTDTFIQLTDQFLSGNGPMVDWDALVREL